jgi:hypothetical protein
VEDYFKLQGRFKHMSAAQIKAVQEDVDAAYAALEKLASGG